MEKTLWFLSRLRSKCETIGVTISGDGAAASTSQVKVCMLIVLIRL